MEAAQIMETVTKEESVSKKKGVSGSTLKLIAVFTMLIDHVGAAILGRYVMLSGYMDLLTTTDVNVINQWLVENATLYYVYTATRMIGRVAFPIFCFLMVEGFLKTRDVKKYALRLGAFALISEIPFDLAFSAEVLEFDYQNVYFTLFFGLLTMVAFDYIAKSKLSKPLTVLGSMLALAAGAGVAELLHTDYGAIGVASILVLYVFRKNKVWQIVSGCLVFLWEFTAPFAFIPIGFYNGKRGLKLKYFFYAFYPLHLAIIYIVCLILGIAAQSAI